MDYIKNYLCTYYKSDLCKILSNLYWFFHIDPLPNSFLNAVKQNSIHSTKFETFSPCLTVYLISYT